MPQPLARHLAADRTVSRRSHVSSPHPILFYHRPHAAPSSRPSLRGAQELHFTCDSAPNVLPHPASIEIHVLPFSPPTCEPQRPLPPLLPLMSPSISHLSHSIHVLDPFFHSSPTQFRPWPSPNYNHPRANGSDLSRLPLLPFLVTSSDACLHLLQLPARDETYCVDLTNYVTTLSTLCRPTYVLHRRLCRLSRPMTGK